MALDDTLLIEESKLRLWKEEGATVLGTDKTLKWDMKIKQIKIWYEHIARYRDIYVNLYVETAPEAMKNVSICQRCRPTVVSN